MILVQNYLKGTRGNSNGITFVEKGISTEEEFAQAKKVILEIRDKIEKGDQFVDWVRKESDDSGNDGNLGEFGQGANGSRI